MTARLDELVVRNLGVLEVAALEPGPGLTVITGETGAGKTMLVGALSALLGGGLDAGRIGPAGDEVEVSVRVVDGDEIIARARLARGGRTRSYLDGSVAAAAEVADRLAEVVEIVAQHDGLRLRRDGALRRMVDGVLDEAGLGARADYRKAWEALVETDAAIAALGDDERGLRRELEVSRHEAEEIEAATLVDGEIEDLEATVERLRNVDAIVETVVDGERALDEADEALGRAVDALRRLDRLDPAAGLAGGAERSAVEAAEALADLRRYRGDLTHDPDGLALAQARLARIGELRRRYGPDVAAIRSYGAAAAARVVEIETLLERATSLDAERKERLASARSLGDRLRTARSMAGSRLVEAATRELRDLGFTDPLLELRADEADPGPNGADRLSLHFASDRRLDARPIGSGASGGELSRIVLALRLAGGVADVPVVVFDEVDAGVGGSTALAMGAKLAAVAEEAQVLCVTHLPQVAAHADHHWVVERTGPTASIRRVQGEDRVTELTRMLSGLAESDDGRSHARELLAIAGGAGRPGR